MEKPTDRERVQALYPKAWCRLENRTSSDDEDVNSDPRYVVYSTKTPKPDTRLAVSWLSEEVAWRWAIYHIDRQIMQRLSN